MENNGTPKEIRRRPIFSIEGIVTKAGEGWMYVEENADTVEVKRGDETFLEKPYGFLVCFQKDKDYNSKIVEGEVHRFFVETVLDWDNKLRRPVIKHWLRGVVCKKQVQVKPEPKQPEVVEVAQPQQSTNSETGRASAERKRPASKPSRFSAYT